MRYVIYDVTSGALLGAYVQELQPEHAHCYIEVLDEVQYWNWPAYKANAARDGLELAPVVAPPAQVPLELRADQLAVAALDAGVWDAIQAYFAGLPDDAAGNRARIRFQRRPTVRRDCDLVAAAANDLGLTSSEIDAIFVAGAMVD